MTDLIAIRKSSLSFSNAFLNNEKRPYETYMQILVYFYFVHVDNNHLTEDFTIDCADKDISDASFLTFLDRKQKFQAALQAIRLSF